MGVDTMTRRMAITGLCLGLGCTPPINEALSSEAPEAVGGADTGQPGGEFPCEAPVIVYFDADGDGFGDDRLQTQACEVPSGHTDRAGDCDDLDASVFPGAEERCDGLDQDCDGEIDEGVERLTLYEDGDGDGYGHPELQFERCEAVEGLVENGDDCNDEDPRINPGATEVLDKTDVDCSGVVDDLTTDEAIARLSGEDPSDGFGYAIADGTDLDFGGITDVVIGSRARSEVWIFPGEELADDSPMLTLSGMHEGDQFGRAVSLLEDINADGHADLVVGAPAASPEISGAASISLFLGPLSEREDGAAPDYSTPPVPGAEAGAVLADIGPIVDDRQFFAVQATTKVGGTLGVKLYRVTERSGLDDAVEVSGSGSGDRFGEAIASRFDADGDGFSDLAIGAPGAGADDLIAGAVYVFLSPVDTVMTLEDADLVVLGDADSAEFGAAVGTSDDMDGDGRQDLIVGSPGSSDGAGMAQIITIAELEGVVPAEAAAWGTLTDAAGRLGQTVHASADVDGDGHPDAIVGAPEAAGAGVDAGAVYVFWGGAGPGVFAPDASIEAVAPHVGLGTALGVTRSGPSGEFQALLVGGDGADVDDAGDEEDQTGALWMFGFEG